jgi:UDP-glucose 4-epimerase
LFKNKILLITGGTGSFGNAVLRKFLSSDIKEIRIFSRDEKKQDDMRNEFQNDKIKFYIGDVRDADSLDFAMSGADYVFHAAALKQVPSCEFYPLEAVKTNILGTENVLNKAIFHGISNVICLSTDKAVYPINAMGISKSMMEKVAVAKSRISSKTVICITRYGNVMASRGSVIPLFISQIKANEALTVTDPNMTRFMMSLDDAVDLVLFAFQNGSPGEIFVQKAPAATVHKLAETLIKIFKSKSKINTIGTRHGEKLYETLLTREEFAHINDLGNYFQIKPDNRELNYKLFFSEGNESISLNEDYNSHNTHRLTDEELEKMLLNLDYLSRELKGLPNA